MATPRKAAIYGLVDPRDGTTRYVGKAQSPKDRLSRHRREAWTGKDRPVKTWIRKLHKSGLEPAMEILEWCTEENWRERESYHISHLRASLFAPRSLNVADGGDSIPCPRSVLARNGRRNARKRSPVWALLRYLGHHVYWLERRGKASKAERFRAWACYVRSSEGKERERFERLAREKWG